MRNESLTRGQRLRQAGTNLGGKDPLELLIPYPLNLVRGLGGRVRIRVLPFGNGPSRSQAPAVESLGPTKTWQKQCRPGKRDRSFVNKSWPTVQESKRLTGFRIEMARETIGMQVRGIVALIAEPSLVLVALAATAQSDLVPDPVPHRFIPEFVEKDPVVLPHPTDVSHAALRGGRRNLQERFRGRHGEPCETRRAVCEWGQNDDSCDGWK